MPPGGANAKPRFSQRVSAGRRALSEQSKGSWVVIVSAVVNDALSPDFPLGVELGVFIRREDAQRFIKGVRGGDPELASYLRIEQRELEVGGLN